MNFGMRVIKPLILTPEQGADTAIFLATTPDPTPFAGGYLSRRKLRTTFGQGTSDAVVEGLWRESARRAGLEAT